MKKFKVALAAGHGGHGVTPGKRTPDGEYEWNFNNKVISSAIEFLEQYDDVIDVLRLDDPSGRTDVPLSLRTYKANAWNADILIADHHNANTGRWGNWTGTETYTYIGDWEDAERLAGIIHNNVLGAYGLRDRGLKKADFHMLRETHMPAILIEGGYMDSVIDIEKLRDDEVLKNAGIAIGKGILEYAKIKERKSKKHTPKEEKVESVEVDRSGSFIGKRVEAIVNNLDFYDRPTWNDKYRVGQIDKGWGFPEIVAKVTVDGSDQYKVKNSKGDVYYITAHPKYVKLEGEGRKPEPKKDSGIPVLGHIEIVNVSHAAYICDRPSSTSSKNLDTAKRGSTWPIAGSVPGWYEIIYKGRRAYVNAKYGKRV